MICDFKYQFNDLIADPPTVVVRQPQTPESASQQQQQQREHAAAGRSLSLPLGICLSSRQTSHPGGSANNHSNKNNKVHQSAIFANPFAEAVLAREMADKGVGQSPSTRGVQGDRDKNDVKKRRSANSAGEENSADTTLVATSSDSEGYGSRTATPSSGSNPNKAHPVKAVADEAATVKKR